MLLPIRNSTFDLARRPLVMGVLNVTPDSFSDGGAFVAPSAAVGRALQMLSEGADIVDVGPESTRPGAAPVPVEEQIRRAVPVIAELHRQRPQALISVDTRVAAVAQAAIEAGACIVNDVSALRDDAAMAGVVAQAGATVVLMHMKGTPADMQAGGGPHYDDVVGEVGAFLRARAAAAESAGVARDRVIIDPGLGFGKRHEHNLTLIRHLDRLADMGYPVLVGASRKSFVGKVLGVDDPGKRIAGSVACALLAVMGGAHIVRVHDVRETVEALRMLAAVRGAPA